MIALRRSTGSFGLCVGPVKPIRIQSSELFRARVNALAWDGSKAALHQPAGLRVRYCNRIAFVFYRHLQVRTVGTAI